MGRGAYDTTNPSRKKSAMGDAALTWEASNKRDREEAAAERAAENVEAKLIRSKKSRGIMAARRALMNATAKFEPEGR